MKPRFSVYLSDAVAHRLEMAAKLPGGSKSAIVEEAVSRFLDPERDRGLDAALIRRLDRTSKTLSIVERDVAIVTETVALFVRYFLTITPPLPAGEQGAARALGRERFQVFIAQVGRRLGSDRRLVSEVLETIVATNPDLFAEATDDAPLKGGATPASAPRHEAARTNGSAPEIAAGDKQQGNKQQGDMRHV